MPGTVAGAGGLKLSGFCTTEETGTDTRSTRNCGGWCWSGSRQWNPSREWSVHAGELLVRQRGTLSTRETVGEDLLQILNLQGMDGMTI